MRHWQVWLTVIGFLALMNAPLLAQKPSSITDRDITLAVETQLLTDDSVLSHLIDIETNDGIVKLSGIVDNLLSKERARQIAESVKGVRAVVNTLTIRSTVRTDEQILRDVQAALQADPATDSYEVEATVEDGVVTLSGVVDSWQEKQLSALVVKGVEGVKDVNNALSIAYKHNRPDYEIEMDIQRRLAADVWVDADPIEVEVNAGKVILQGTVGSAAEKSRAQIDAWVAGVDSVDASDLQVEWWARTSMRRDRASTIKSDAEIVRAVKDAFRYDPRVSAFQPQVTAENGIVTLSGVVDNLAAKRAAKEDARHTVGVWRVENHLRVRPVTLLTDADIARKVRAALSRDVAVERHEIMVNVRNAKVTLLGTVESRFEQQHAADVAARVNGVVAVENHLKVDYTPSRKLDWQIKQDIDRELWWSPYVDSEEVAVSVQDGVATLVGMVDTWLEHGAAIQNAYEGGAQSVRDRLKVKEGPAYYLPSE